MCGIVGFYSPESDLSSELILSLKKLEYRGYDSSGIAILTGGEIYCKKAVGKVVELENVVKSSKAYSKPAKLGIAHTRWATHGLPTEQNAHPHHSFDGKIWLVHNGIIENYRQLKEELEKEGVQFYSQTDTEIIANLIAVNYSGDLKHAVLEALKRVIGAYAILVFSSDEPDRMVAIKNGSPLILGIGDGELILASDVSALIHKTREVIYLENNELVDVFQGRYEISIDDKLSQIKKTEYIDWQESAANKNGYKHFLIKEIMEQPKVIEDSIRGRILDNNMGVKFGGLDQIKDSLQAVDKVLIIGIGTSYYAAKLGQMYFEELLGIEASCELSSEFRYKNTKIDSKTWVIVLSQSGETADTIAALEEAKSRGAIVTGIVNTVGSSISRLTDAGVYNHIGPEISVASTKAFTSQVVLLLMHAIYLANIKDLKTSDTNKILADIAKLPEQIQSLLNNNEKIESIAKKYYNYRDFMYIGRRFNYPVALEGALKLKEISYIHAEGLSGGELKHGFIALIDKDFPTLALAPKDSGFEKMVSNIEEIKARSGPVVAITTEDGTEIEKVVDDVIYVPKSDSTVLQPIINNIAQQLFAYYCADLKGGDVDKPRNLAKSVTVE